MSSQIVCQEGWRQFIVDLSRGNSFVGGVVRNPEHVQVVLAELGRGNYPTHPQLSVLAAGFPALHRLLRAAHTGPTLPPLKLGHRGVARCAQRLFLHLASMCDTDSCGYSSLQY